MIPYNSPRLDMALSSMEKLGYVEKRRHHHQYAGLISTSLTPYMPDRVRYKGGGIFGSIAISVVLGAVTGGLGAWIGPMVGAGVGLAGGIGTFLGFTGITAGIVGGAVLGLGTGLLSAAASMFTGQQKSPSDTNSYTAELHDNKITLRVSTPPRKILYGTALAAGAMVYATSTGSTHEYMHMVNPIVTHQVKAMREVYFNNNIESTSRFTNFYRVNKHLGTQTQAADSDLVSEAGGEWTSQHRLREIAYIYPRLKYDSNAWVTGLPTTAIMVDGAIVYDPRNAGVAITTSSIASPGVFNTLGAHSLSVGDIVFIKSHIGATYVNYAGLTVAPTKRYTVNTVPTTTSFTLLDETGTALALTAGGSGGTVTKMAWSSNSALCILDYLLSPDGINCTVDEIDWTYFQNAATTCDENVDLGNSQTFTVSPTSDQLTLANGVGWATGTQVYVSSTTTLPSPLVAGTAYYWIDSSTDATIGQLASSYANAISGTQIDITTTGSGIHTITVSTSAITATSGTITLSDTSTYIETGDCVNLTGTLAGTDYYWFNTGYKTGSIATSRANAIAGTAASIGTAETVQITRKNQARYTTNGILDLSKKPIDLLNDLLTACGGALVYTQGAYRLFPAAAATSVKTITQDDLRDTIKILPHTSRTTLSNAVRGTYCQPAKYWEMTDFAPITNATYENEDGNQRLYSDSAYPYTIDSNRAQRLASIALGRARRGMVVNFPSTVKMLGISAWDCVTLNLTVGSSAILSGKKFRVSSWAIAENGNGIDLTLLEEDDAIYTWSYSNATNVPQNDLSSLPTPWIVSAPSSLTVQSGTAQLYVAGDGTVHSRAYLSWVAPTDTYVLNSGWIDIQYKKSADSTWISAAPVPGFQTSTYIIDVDDGVSYDFRVRSRNSLGAVSDRDGTTWAQTVTGHTVLGKSAPPSDVASFSAQPNGNVVTFRWSAITDTDRTGYELRYMAAPFIWDNAIVLSRETKGTLVTNAGLPPGTWVCGIKAIDTSGNYSVNAATTTISTTNTNSIISESTANPRWVGTKSGFINHWVSGTLIPDSNTLASAMTDAQLWDQMCYDPVSSPYFELPEIDLGADTDGVRLWANMAAYLGAGETGVSDPILSIALKPDGGSYGAFQDWSVGTISGTRYIKARIRLDTATGVAAIYGFTLTIDAEPRSETFANQTIAVGGTTITFSQPFHVAPGITITAQASGGSARIGIYDTLTTTSVKVYIHNTSDTDTGGTATIVASGA